MSKRTWIAVLTCLVCVWCVAPAALGAESHAGSHEAHDPGHGNAVPGLNDAAEIRGDLAVYTFVVFLLLLALLGRFAWPTIASALEEREKMIEGNIAAAEAKLRDAKELVAVHEAKIAKATDEVRELLEEARRDAEKTKAQIIAEARSAAEAERDRAMREVTVATDHALHRLAETSANLAVDLAGKVVQHHITAEQQSSLVREAIGRLGNVNPTDN